MKCRVIIEKIEEWAPREIAWDRDNPGLQVGSEDREINKILLTLDLTEPVLDEAIKDQYNLIISHHPLLFNPLKKIDTLKDTSSRLIEKLIKHDITLYSSHTNLDYAKDGVSFELASRLKLLNIRFLKNLKDSQSKIVVFVPADSVKMVSDAVFENGGGVIGEYSKCSYRTDGRGTFRGSVKTNPSVGVKENFETVEEVRLEFTSENWKINNIIRAMIEAHPYEEPAYDIYPLNNKNVKYGIGAVGELEQSAVSDYFLEYVSEKLKINNFRYTGLDYRKEINKVAVCGGSGAEYLNEAINAGADAFITADVKYHSFHEAGDKILLIDAGHYETEIFALDAIERFLLRHFKDVNVKKFSGKLNPVNFYNNQGAK